MNYRFRLLIRLRPVLRFIKFRILHVDDSAQRMARGVAAGCFVAYLPVLGLHIPLAFILAQLIRANKALAVVALDQIQEMLNQTFSLSYMIVNLFTIEYWKQVASVFTKIGLETCIGGIILGAVVAKIGYWVTYYFIIGYRTRKADRKQRNVV
jgi:uncharacterized protein (DUF2062 family)